ncbi:hypothetical protein Mgra_00000687 [Meloidogyne graminicola]|uniref:C2 domain-containing protein n=1 Tax=Meloidogyne graminicola TaxID=189291 RepID=A0A8T0A2X3_9BILA|nr:hypothetical protein Mgra_00000687 [Meloidogyne graminicola]
MEGEPLFFRNDRGPSSSVRSPPIGQNGRNSISFGSQMLAVGAGFCVFIVLLAFFAAIQHRKRRRNSSSSSSSSFVSTSRSPLIHKFSSSSGQQRHHSASQAIPPPLPPPQYLRCSNQNLRKCSSPGGSDYSLSSSSSTYSSAHSLSPISPYGHNNPHQQQHQQQYLIGGTNAQGNLFTGIDFNPYGNNGGRISAPPPTAATISFNGTEKRRSFPYGQQHNGTTNNVGNIPSELIIDKERGRGSVSLQLAYDVNNLALQITVLACNGLPKFSDSTPLNPYIKLRLLPDGQHRVKTRILRDTTEPIFDEAFTMYGLGAETIKNCQLHLAALAFDRYNGDTVLGEAIYSLSSADLSLRGEPCNISLKWEERQPFNKENCNEQKNYFRGKALVAINYETKTRQIQFALKQMADLPKDMTLGLPDPYAKIYALINGTKRIAKHKTNIYKRTQTPLFNENDWLNFTLPVGLGNDGIPKTLSFQVVLFNHDGVKRNEPIGQFTIDAESPQFINAFKDNYKLNKIESVEEEWHNIQAF